MGKLVRKDDHSVAIIGICDLVPAMALINGGTLDELEYTGEIDVHWDGQYHERRYGGRVFIDENDDEVLEKDVEVIDAD